MKKEIERLIVKGYIHQFLKKNFHPKQNRENLGQSTTTLFKINIILGGTSIERVLAMEREIIGNKPSPPLRSLVQWHEPIVFIR